MVETTLEHENNNVREFYSTLPRPVRVGIEATGSMQWFVNLMEEREDHWNLTFTLEGSRRSKYAEDWLTLTQTCAYFASTRSFL